MSQFNVLIITRNLPPLVGGMERLLWHVIDTLSSEYRVCVVGPSGCSKTLPDNVHVIEVPSHSLSVFLLASILATFRFVVSRRPRLVFAGSGLLAPIAWCSSRIIGAKSAVYLHGLDIRVDHAIYRKCWLPFFRHFDKIVVNSKFTKKLALEVGVRSERIEIVPPGVTLPDLGIAQEQAHLFRLKYGWENRPLLLFVGRITARKGLACFVELILPFIIAERPNALLVVVGGDAVNALQKNGNERIKIESFVKENGFEENISFLGQCSDVELDQAYFAADLLVFPVQERENDIEGFGMVALEAAAHGLPTVAFAVGGVTDAVSEGRSGRLIQSGKNTEFTQAVLQILSEESQETQSQHCVEFAKAFEWKSFGQKIRAVFRQIIENSHRGKKKS